MKSQALSDIEEMWPHYGQPVHWFAKLGRAIYGGIAEEPLDLVRIVQTTNEVDGNVYVHINSIAGNATKGSAQDVMEWKNVLVDIDPVRADAQPWKAANAILFNGHYELSNYSVIDSGRGYQLWLRIADADIRSDDDRRRFEASTAMFLRSLQPMADPYGCVVDTSCSDLSRVARVPGNFNPKTGKVCALVQAAETSMPASTFLHNHPAILPTSRATRAEFTGSWNLARAVPHLTTKGAEFVVSGVRAPGRHAAAFAAAASLAEAGVPEELARLWVLRGAKLCTPMLTEASANRAFDNAWRKKRNETA